MIKQLALFYSAIFVAAWLAPSSVAASVSSHCSGIDILYPKSGTVMRKRSDPSQYLVLGNAIGDDAKLRKIEVVHEKDGKGRSEVVYMTNREAMTRVVAVQHDLNRLKAALPHRFWYRVDVLQNGVECVYDSEKFEINDV